MKKTNTIKLLGLLASYFPQFQGFDQQPVIEAWHNALQDLDYETACEAIRKLALTFTQSKYPNIAHIREAYAELTQPDVFLDAAEAWKLIVSRIRQFGRQRRHAALQSLPGSLHATVQALGWQNLCDSTRPEVDRAHFLKLYQAAQHHQQEEAILPHPSQYRLPSKGQSMRQIP